MTSLHKRAFSLLELSIVIVIIGVLIVGIVGSKHLIAKSRLTTAMAMTRSSVVSGTSNNKLWIESSLSEISLGANLSTGDSITSWLDNSSNKTAITISAVGLGAEYANTINYIQAVKFGDSSDENHLQIDDASFLNGSNYTIFITEKRMATNSGGGNYLLGSNGSFAVGYESGSTVIQTHGEEADDDNQASIEGLGSYSNKPRVISFIHSSIDGNKIYINGTLANEDTTSTAKAHLSGITTLAIGNNYNGEIGEIAIFDRDLKSIERKEIENYLTDKWNAPNNRESTISCTTGTITSTGCDASCSAPSVNGITSSSSISNGSSSSYSCDDTGYSGSTPTYSCSGGVLSPTPAISDCTNNGCDSGYLVSSNICVQGCSVAAISGTSDSGTVVADGVVVTCDEAGYDGSTIATCLAGNSITGSCDCGSGYNSDGGTCKAQCTLSSGSSGLPSDVTVNSGSSAYDCSNVSGYTGTVSYTCNNGSISSISGTCSSGASCTGGTEDTTSVSGYKLHIFTSSSTLNCTSGGEAQVLVVAGGGGGGGCISGGGGAGGVVYNSSYTLSTGNTAVTVGAGGAGGIGWSSPEQYGKKGGDSVFGTITAYGGGGGADHRYGPHPLPNDGGSGGGDALHNTDSGGIQDNGVGTSGQGYNGGGCGSASNCYDRAGGGGGAGGVGGTATSTLAGNGGLGVDYSSIFSSNYGDSGWFASGGGGGVRISTGSTPGTASQGGGGNGSTYTIGATSADANTGGGGGGAGFDGINISPAGGNGGSGIVIVRYAN